MGRVTAAIEVENYEDVLARRAGVGTHGVRAVSFATADADDNTITPCLPAAAVAALGLERTRSVRAVRVTGPDTATVCGPVRLTVNGRSCTLDVLELPDTTVPRLGRLALLALDLVPDPASGTLIGNPAHGGE